MVICDYPLNFILKVHLYLLNFFIKEKQILLNTIEKYEVSLD